MVWYSYLFKNFPQFVVIHTINMVNETEVNVLLEFTCFFHDPVMLAISSLVPLSFLNPACTSGSSQFSYC